MSSQEAVLSKEENLESALKHMHKFTAPLDNLVHEWLVGMHDVEEQSNAPNYRLIGGKSYMKVLDEAARHALMKVRHCNEEFMHNFLTLDWDVVITDGNCADAIAALNGIVNKNGNRVVACLNRMFEHDYSGMVSVVKFGNKEEKKNVSYEGGVDSVPFYHYYVELNVGDKLIEVGYLDVLDATKTKPHQFDSACLFLFEDFYGIKVQGFCDAVSKMEKSFANTAFAHKQNKLYERAQVVLNFAKAGLLHWNYYAHVACVKHHNPEDYKNYIEHLQGNLKKLCTAMANYKDASRPEQFAVTVKNTHCAGNSKGGEYALEVKLCVDSFTDCDALTSAIMRTHDFKVNKAHKKYAHSLLCLTEAMYKITGALLPKPVAVPETVPTPVVTVPENNDVARMLEQFGSLIQSNGDSMVNPEPSVILGESVQHGGAGDYKEKYHRYKGKYRIAF